MLDEVDFKIPQQAFVGILGSNGSSKTTLIRTLLGLQPCLKGRVVARGLADGARLGYAPQTERLDTIYPLTAFRVAAMGTDRRWQLPGLGRARRNALVERCLKDCGALELAHKRFGDLSGGQRQRTLIARALASEPEILVLDEPLAGIDAATQQALLDLLGKLKQEGRFTILMVSHRIQAEKDLFTHVVWVAGGRATLGPAQQMLASEDVAAAFRSGL